MIRLQRYLPLVFAFGVFACEGEDGRPEYSFPTQSLEELLAAEPDASTFLDLVRATMFAGALSGGDSLTILAPANAAFSGLNTAMLKEEPEELSALLRFHVLAGTIDIGLMDLGGEFRTITGTVVRVEASGTTITITDHLGVSAMLNATKRNIYGRNGVLHIIDKVLTPPPPPVAPGPGNLVEELEAADGFATLLDAVDGTAAATVMTGTAPATVFAPTDAAFTALGVDLSMVDAAVVENILLNHVVTGKQGETELMMDPTLTSLAGLPLVVEGDGATVGGVTIGDAVDASNGVAHTIGMVLVPDTAVEYIASQNEAALQLTNMAITRAATELGTALTPNTLMGDDPITIFAPNQMAWMDAGIAVGTIGTSTLAAILRRHTVTGQFLAEDLLTMDGMELMTLNGTVTVQVDGMTVTLERDMSSATVMTADTRTLTGAVHVVDGILR